MLAGVWEDTHGEEEHGDKRRMRRQVHRMAKNILVGQGHTNKGGLWSIHSCTTAWGVALIVRHGKELLVLESMRSLVGRSEEEEAGASSAMAVRQEAGPMRKFVGALDHAVQVMRESGGVPQRIAVEHARRLQAVVAQLGNSQLPNAKRQRELGYAVGAAQDLLTAPAHPGLAPEVVRTAFSPICGELIDLAATMDDKLWARCTAFAEAVGADSELLQGRLLLQERREERRQLLLRPAALAALAAAAVAVPGNKVQLLAALALAKAGGLDEADMGEARDALQLLPQRAALAALAAAVVAVPSNEAQLLVALALAKAADLDEGDMGAAGDALQLLQQTAARLALAAAAMAVPSNEAQLLAALALAKAAGLDEVDMGGARGALQEGGAARVHGGKAKAGGGKAKARGGKIKPRQKVAKGSAGASSSSDGKVHGWLGAWGCDFPAGLHG